MGAAADCEAIGQGFLGQPIDALTSLAFVLVGLWLLGSALWIGLAVLAIGVGSFLFHGPMPEAAEWAHDVSLVWLLAVVASHGTRWQRLSQVPALVAIGVAVSVAPGVADPLAVAFTAFGVTVLLWRDRSWATLRPLVLLAVVGVYGRLGATGGPFCDASSVWQPHGIWHLGAAAALWWLFRPLRSLGSRVSF